MSRAGDQETPPSDERVMYSGYRFPSLMTHRPNYRLQSCGDSRHAAAGSTNPFSSAGRAPASLGHDRARSIAASIRPLDTRLSPSRIGVRGRGEVVLTSAVYALVGGGLVISGA